MSNVVIVEFDKVGRMLNSHNGSNFDNGPFCEKFDKGVNSVTTISRRV